MPKGTHIFSLRLVSCCFNSPNQFWVRPHKPSILLGFPPWFAAKKVKLTEEQGRLEAEPGPRGEASWAKLR